MTVSCEVLVTQTSVKPVDWAPWLTVAVDWTMDTEVRVLSSGTVAGTTLVETTMRVVVGLYDARTEEQ